MAPPSYKPLTSAGGLTGAPGLPAEIFAPPADITLDAVIQANAQARANELANQANAIAVEEKQRQVDQQAQIRNQLIAQYGPQTDPETGEITQPDNFDPSAALQTAQRTALQGGDLDTAINVQKSMNSFTNSSNRVLSAEEVQSLRDQGLDVIDGETLAGARLKMSLKNSMAGIDRTNAVQSRFEENAPIRNLNEKLLTQKVEGTQIRPPTAAQVAKIGAGDAFIAQMNNMEETYIPLISENRGVRFLEAAANPNSAEARLYAELNLAAKQAALSLEDRVTDADYKIIEKIITPNALDTNETIIDKMKRLKQFITERNSADLSALTAGGFNVEGLKNRPDFQKIPKVTGFSTSAIPRNPDGSILTREQFMALKNKGTQ